MLNYRLQNGLPAGSRAAWSRFHFLPLCGAFLTPFSYSVLSEIAGRAWFAYYDALGFDPVPRARVVRQYNGRPYFNLTLSAQREAEMAAIDGVTLIIDGAPFPVAKVEKMGFLAGLKAGRNEKKQQERLAAYAAEATAMKAVAREWYEKVSGFRWTQAEILMVMEEIEPVSVAPFAAYLGARQGILLAVNRLMRWSSLPPAETLALIDNAFGASGGVVEAEIARRLSSLATRVPQSMRAELAVDSAQSWEDRLRAAGILEEAAAFLAEYGYRASSAGEIAEPRWSDEPALLLRALANPPQSRAAGDDSALAQLRASVESANRKAAEQAFDALRVLVPLQSQAMDALSLILAGARKWAWGAAGEASLDQRIVALDNVYFYELEELKEMMTGEWNISDRAGIQNTAEKRRVQVAQWRAAKAPELMIGDAPAEAIDTLPHSVIVEPWRLLAGEAHEPSPV